MSNYYKYKFISPEKLYARVQEELRSYFSTGAIDTVLFPLWTDDCLQRFRKTFLPIRQTLLCIKDGKTELPCDFNGVREAWITTTSHSDPFVSKGAIYYPKDHEIVTLTDTNANDYEVDVRIETYQVVRKIEAKQVYTFKHRHLLHEGVVAHCSSNHPVYEIEDETVLKTTYTNGEVHLIYYSDGLDEDGYQMIPDDFRTQDYIRKYIIYKCFMQIWNQTTDETFNQISQKMQMAKQESDEAFILADIESKKETLDQKIKRIKKSRSRLDGYRL